MTSKNEQYRLRILKTYSIIVDFEGDPKRENVPSPEEGETFNQWCKRVLGDGVHDVMVYGPWKPAPQTKMKTIQGWSGMMPLKKTYNALVSEINCVRREAKQENECLIQKNEQLVRAYETFSRETILDVMEALGQDIEPAVEEFLNKFLEKHKDGELSVNLALSELISRFNANARSFRLAKD